MSDHECREPWLDRVRERYLTTRVPGAEQGRKRIEAALRSEPPPGRRRQARPTFRPRLWALAAALAILVGGAVWMATGPNRWERGGGPAALAPSESTSVVRFTLSAPGASSVSVVGDFNGWDTKAAPMSEVNAGFWAISVPVSHGRHVYAFVVDRTRWVSDPDAPLSPEDGFGVASSVVVVGGGT